jgi:ABC-type molybdate transport system substrate-binding protein
MGGIELPLPLAGSLPLALHLWKPEQRGRITTSNPKHMPIGRRVRELLDQAGLLQPTRFERTP